MFVSSLRLDGFRGVSETIDLASPLAVVVGENNSGKSTTIDALRSVLWPTDGPQARRWLRIEDFTRANRVAGLLRALAPVGHTDRDAMDEILRGANLELDDVDSMQTAEKEIADHLRAMVSQHYALPSDLRFAPAQFEAIIRTLRGHIGEIATLPIESTGLGMHNPCSWPSCCPRCAPVLTLGSWSCSSRNQKRTCIPSSGTS